jgi:hypothetical protein
MFGVAVNVYRRLIESPIDDRATGVDEKIACASKTPEVVAAICIDNDPLPITLVVAFVEAMS